MITGDSQVLAGQVQMIYIDPLYGIKYDFSFLQPFIDQRSAKDGKDLCLCVIALCRWWPPRLKRRNAL